VLRIYLEVRGHGSTNGHVSASSRTGGSVTNVRLRLLQHPLRFERRSTSTTEGGGKRVRRFRRFSWVPLVCLYVVGRNVLFHYIIENMTVRDESL
jgi:hypothetical protein